jgi:hypothetical protein
MFSRGTGVAALKGMNEGQQRNASAILAARAAAEAEAERARRDAEPDASCDVAEELDKYDVSTLACTD